MGGLFLVVLGGEAVWGASRFSNEIRSLIQLTGELQERSEPSVVFTDFNDAGWAELGFYLASSPKQSPYLLAIDGRTLVVGAKRLEEYSSILNQRGGWEDVFSKWNVQLAIIRQDAAFKELLIEKDWKIIDQTSYWVVLEEPKVNFS
jgi:hypothetical protein